MKLVPIVLLMACGMGVADVGEKYDVFAARMGKPISTDQKDGATMVEFKGDGYNVFAVVLDGVIVSHIYSEVDFATAEKLVKQHVKGSLALSKRVGEDAAWRSPDGTYRATFESKIKALMVHHWPVYSAKFLKGTR